MNKYSQEPDHKKLPLVSIIIPAYNAERYIKEAIDSALAQTYTAIEIIVINDGSTDRTREVIDPYISLKNFRYLSQNNQGLSSARNTGIQNSHGEFIALLDSDDIFLPQKVERQVNYLISHPECDVCYCNILYFYSDLPEKLLNLNYVYYSKEEVFPRLLEKMFIKPLSVMLRRRVVDHFGLFDENYRRSEDYEYWLRIAHGGARFDFLPERLAKYRVHQDSHSFISGFSGVVAEKKAAVLIFKNLAAKMSAEERKKYKITSILSRHRFKYFSVKVAEHIPFLQGIYWRMQRRRFGDFNGKDVL